MALISELETKMTVNNSQFLAGIHQSTKSVSKFVEGVKHIAEALVVFELLKTGVEKVVEIISEGTEKISQLEEASKRIGIGVGPLQELQYAAKQSGVGIDSLNRSLLFMEKNVGNGAGATVTALGKLGLTLDDIKKMSPEKMFTTLAAAIKGLKDPTDQASVSAALFGRGGMQLMSLFKRDVSELTGEFKKFGGELTGEQTEGVKKYAESVNKLSSIWEAFKLQLTAAVAGPFKQVIDWITQTILKMGGIGAVAAAFAKAIISAVQISISEFSGLLNITDSVIINLEKIIKLFLQVGEVSTLGLSKIFSSSDKWIDSLKTDIAAREKSRDDRTSTAAGLSDGLTGLNSQISATQQNNDTKHTLDVNVKVDDGLFATISESPEVTAKVNKLVNSYLADSASSVGK
jgi:hypothetical protein